MTEFTGRYIWNARTPMRDGVELSSDIYLPSDEGIYPAIIHRTPYDNTSPFFVSQAQYFADKDYAFVYQDVRGRGDSDGVFEPFVNEFQDGYDTVEWVAQQPWCDGKIGMLGGSYAGTTQWFAAREQPPHLRTFVSTAAAGRWMHESPYQNGKFQPYFIWWLNLVSGRTNQDTVWGVGAKTPVDFERLFRTRPLKNADVVLGRPMEFWQAWLGHNTYDAYWQSLSLDAHYKKIDLPILHITGWFDGDQWGELYHYNRMIMYSPAADRQWLLIGPWDHHDTREPSKNYGGMNFGDAAIVDMNDIHLRWFDYWLKGIESGVMDEAKVRYFVMGRNTWETDDVWKPSSASVKAYYLHSTGQANTAAGDGSLTPEKPTNEPADTYRYDPDHPTPSSDLEQRDEDNGPLNNGFIERRDEVLVYTSEKFQDPIEVSGTVFLKLFAESDCIDTDFMAIISDVDSDGHSFPLTQAVMRASYRNGSAAPTPIKPGAVVEYTLEFMAISMEFQPGHQLRLTILSSLYPAWDINPNTGAPQGEDATGTGKIAQQIIYHNADHPSHLLLPIVLRGQKNSE